MALIECPECGRNISDQAEACPECAYPLAATTIEQTAKSYKGAVVVGILTMAGGFVLWVSGEVSLSAGADVMSAFGLVFVAIGFVTVAWAKIGAWWDHA